MAANVAEDLIPLLLATLNNPSINFLRMAAMDPQERSLDWLAHIFEDWRVEGRKMEHNYAVKVASKARKGKGRKKKGKPFNPEKLPKEWEKFKPQPDDSVDQLELKRLARDGLTREKFIDAMYELENYEFLTKEQIDHIEAVRRAAIQREREEIVRQEEEDAEERRRDAEEAISSEDLRDVGESDTDGNGWPDTDSDDSDDGDDGDDGDGGDSGDASPTKIIKDDETGTAKPVKKPRKARQATEDTDRAGASRLNNSDSIKDDGGDDGDDGDGGRESPAKKVKDSKEGVGKPIKKPRKARQATEDTNRAGALGLNDNDLIGNDGDDDSDGVDESPAKKVKGNEEGFGKSVKKPRKARQAKKDTNGAGASGLNDNDLIQNDSEEEKPEPRQKRIRKPRAPVASKAKGKAVPTAPVVEEKPMKKRKADAPAIKASRKAAGKKEPATGNVGGHVDGGAGAAISGIGGESENQPREGE
jgi:hypothetical protein